MGSRAEGASPGKQRHLPYQSAVQMPIRLTSGTWKTKLDVQWQLERMHERARVLWAGAGMRTGGGEVHSGGNRDRGGNTGVGGVGRW